MRSEPLLARSGWTTLRTGAEATDALEIPTIPSAVSTHDGPVRFALGDQGEPRVLLPLRSAARLPRMQISEALQVRLCSYHLGPRRLWFLDLSCLSPGLEPVFGEVADEMLRRIASGNSCIEACRATLSDFRALLVQPLERALPDHVILGLAGELLVLRDLVRMSADAWKAWRGPLGERHDFRAGPLALEVKTSARVGEERVRITSVDQLAPPQDGWMRLLHLAFEIADGGAVTVGGLAEEIEAVASDPLEFRRRLAELDCADPYAEGWNRIAFSFERRTGFRVEDGFPRIVARSFPDGALPPGVISLEYDIDLGAAANWKMTAEELDQALSEVIACL